MKWLKQLLCNHDDYTREVYRGGGRTSYVGECKKCGRIKVR